MTTPILETSVSFGLNVKKPWELSKRSVESMLLGFREGEWRDPVERVRSLPWDSLEQKAEKERLPFWTPAGTFSHRANASLLSHSGIYPIDLDDLTESDTTKAIQRAITDRFCLAACRSCRGLGVRLLFRVPKCNSEEHTFFFDQVAEHVRSVYGHEPDTCRDVSRASFVSWDNGLWIFQGADELPLVFPAKKLRCVTQRLIPLCYTSSSLTPHRALSETIFSFLGRDYVPYLINPNGEGFTHESLRALGLRVAVELSRQHGDLDDDILNEVIRAWWGGCHKKRLLLTGKLADYREELRASIEGAMRKEWFHDLVTKWTRWTHYPAFPNDPEDRVIFAIRKHCEAEGTADFFIGCRDAGLVAGTDHVTGWRILRRLTKAGLIQLVRKFKGRKANDYILASEEPARP